MVREDGMRMLSRCSRSSDIPPSKGNSLYKKVWARRRSFLASDTFSSPDPTQAEASSPSIPILKEMSCGE